MGDGTNVPAEEAPESKQMLAKTRTANVCTSSSGCTSSGTATSGTPLSVITLRLTSKSDKGMALEEDKILGAALTLSAPSKHDFTYLFLQDLQATPTFGPTQPNPTRWRMPRAPQLPPHSQAGVAHHPLHQQDSHGHIRVSIREYGHVRSRDGRNGGNKGRKACTKGCARRTQKCFPPWDVRSSLDTFAMSDRKSAALCEAISRI